MYCFVFLLMFMFVYLCVWLFELFVFFVLLFTSSGFCVGYRSFKFGFEGGSIVLGRLV